MLTQSDSPKVSFLNENLNIRKPYTFEDYLNAQKPFIIRIRIGRHPLVIIDGAISNHDTLGINPNEINTISVLKDASATAAFGAKGVNGFIIVTTKRQTKVQGN